jgi:hypothetical protein
VLKENNKRTENQGSQASRFSHKATPKDKKKLKGYNESSINLNIYLRPKKMWSTGPESSQLVVVKHLQGIIKVKTISIITLYTDSTKATVSKTASTLARTKPVPYVALLHIPRCVLFY